MIVGLNASLFTCAIIGVEVIAGNDATRRYKTRYSTHFLFNPSHSQKVSMAHEASASSPVHTAIFTPYPVFIASSTVPHSADALAAIS